MACLGPWPFVLGILALLFHELLWTYSKSAGQLVDGAEVWFRSVTLNPCYGNLTDTAPLGEHVLSQKPLRSQFSEPIPYIHHIGHSKFPFLGPLLLWIV